MMGVGFCLQLGYCRGEDAGVGVGGKQIGEAVLKLHQIGITRFGSL